MSGTPENGIRCHLLSSYCVLGATPGTSQNRDPHSPLSGRCLAVARVCRLCELSALWQAASRTRCRSHGDSLAAAQSPPAQPLGAQRSARPPTARGATVVCGGLQVGREDPHVLGDPRGGGRGGETVRTVEPSGVSGVAPPLCPKPSDLSGRYSPGASPPPRLWLSC